MSQMTSCQPNERSISLPVVIDSHAVAYEWADHLWILINRFSERKTLVYKISIEHEMTLVSELPMMSATVVGCEDQLVVTGSNMNGKPVFIGINSEGEQLWNHTLSEVNPIIWPVASCGDEISIAWQEGTNTIETGLLNLSNNKFEPHESIDVNSSPAHLHSWKDKLHVIWMDTNRIHEMEVSSNEATILDRNEGYADNFTLGFADGKKYYVWANQDHVYFKVFGEMELTSVEIENSKGGELMAISGGEPLAWIQRSEPDIDANLSWNSILVSPAHKLYEVNEYVYAVSFWNKSIVVVHASRIDIIQNK